MAELTGNRRTRGRRSSRSREAYEAVRHAIVGAEIPAGEVVNEGEWAERLGMSRTPIREALSRLAQEGLVERVPNRGTFVRGASLEDLRDIYQLRMVLESLAAEEAVDRLTEAEILETEAAWTTLAQSLEDGVPPDYETVGRLDNAFHMMIVGHCTNSRLREIMQGLNLEVLRYQLLTARLLGNVNSTVAQHLALTQRLKDRDGARLASELRDHIKSAADIIFSAR
jgi:DNA-binding GntR family transcriptional regulator